MGNSLGGRTINILTSKAGVEMLTYHADTSKVDTAAMLKLGLKGELTLNPESILYRTVVSQYQFLTPFRTRSSDLEFMVDRANKNAFLNKFHVKAKVDKDSVNVLNMEISTDHKPYKLHIFCPALFEKLRPGMTEGDVTVDHVLGQHLYLEAHHAGAKWKGFKISKTGNGNEREIEWNGRKLGSGDYTLTDNSFSTTQSLANGKSLTTTITWKNKPDTVAFLLDNAVTVKLDGTERRLDLNMEWGMNKVPDMNFNTAENGHFKATAVGHNARWGDYSVDRDLTWNTGNRKIAATRREVQTLVLEHSMHLPQLLLISISPTIWQPTISRVHSRRPRRKGIQHHIPERELHDAHHQDWIVILLVFRSASLICFSYAALTFCIHQLS